jgi:hypothetical protein
VPATMSAARRHRRPIHRRPRPEPHLKPTAKPELPPLTPKQPLPTPNQRLPSCGEELPVTPLGEADVEPGGNCTSRHNRSQGEFELWPAVLPPCRCM